jgi:hypothetical protein
MSFQFAAGDALVTTIAQSAEQAEQPLEGVAPLDAGLDGMVAWRSEQVPQWVGTYRGFTVSIVVFTQPPPEGEILASLRAQLLELSRRNR